MPNNDHTVTIHTNDGTTTTVHTDRDGAREYLQMAFTSDNVIVVRSTQDDRR